MESEKPFKTVEVIDSRTTQVCKVACMSCIRGHRTTQCGIPVCRTKVFWTVKRPGRPSNSCNCRFGATGGCRCVVAKSACPHKPKKGEKRSGECRCDEQGRFCCLLESSHWSVLFALQKPTVEFFISREALEMSHSTLVPSIPFPMTPSSIGSPPYYGSVPGTPAPLAFANTSSMSSPQGAQASPRSSMLAPQFGVMDLGPVVDQNSLLWNTPTMPQLSEEGRRQQAQRIQTAAHPQSCCDAPPITEPANQPTAYPAGTQRPMDFVTFATPIAPFDTPLIPPPGPSVFDFQKLSNDYYAYQFPSAICQTCGLSGCTCRNCPPVMQSFATGSWAQCCGRKHARTATYVAPDVEATFAFPVEQLPKHQTRMIQAEPVSGQGSCCSGQALMQQEDVDQAALGTVPEFGEYGYAQNFILPDVPANLDLSEFLMSELEEDTGGCCCGDP